MDIAKTEDLIKTHEGLRLAPYKCSANHWTIGWGHSLTAHGEAIPTSISLSKAREYFSQDLIDAISACETIFTGWNDIDDVRQAILVDMAFNLGGPGLRKFKKMIAAVNNRRWNRASVEMLDSRWANQVGSRAVELARMMESGKWPER
jgi:lysozyme